MLRCRSGDFVYDDSEMTTMVADLQQLRLSKNGMMCAKVELTGQQALMDSSSALLTKKAT